MNALDLPKCHRTARFRSVLPPFVASRKWPANGHLRVVLPLNGTVAGLACQRYGRQTCQEYPRAHFASACFALPRVLGAYGYRAI